MSDNYGNGRSGEYTSRRQRSANQSGQGGGQTPPVRQPSQPNYVDRESYDRAKQAHRQQLDSYSQQSNQPAAKQDKAYRQDEYVEKLARSMIKGKKYVSPMQRLAIYAVCGLAVLGHSVYDKYEQLAEYFKSLSSGETPPHKTTAKKTGSGQVQKKAAPEQKAAPAKKGGGSSEKKKRPRLLGKAAKKMGGCLTAPVKSTLKKVALLALILLLLYFMLVHIALSKVNVIDTDSGLADTPAAGVTDIALRHKGSVTNLLLLGVDSGIGEGERSDTIIIASIDHRKNTLKLCSILRDSYVEVPGHGMTKINHSYAYGGAALTKQTVENNFRVKIDGVISVDIQALAALVDAVGGVKINITEAEAGQINIMCDGTVSAGEQLLNGQQAAYYCRIRKLDSDFGRTSRQRTVISAILSKCGGIKSARLLFSSGKFMPYISTDMSSNRVAWLALRSLPAVSSDFEEMHIPVDGTFSFKNVRDMSVIDFRLKDNVEMLHEFIYV